MPRVAQPFPQSHRRRRRPQLGVPSHSFTPPASHPSEPEKERNRRLRARARWLDGSSLLLTPCSILAQWLQNPLQPKLIVVTLVMHPLCGSSTQAIPSINHFDNSASPFTSTPSNDGTAPDDMLRASAERRAAITLLNNEI